MSKHKQKRWHPQLPHRRREAHLEEVLGRVQTLREKGELEEAVEILENAPLPLQRRAEFQLSRGSLYLTMGDIITATEAFEVAQRLDAGNPFPIFFLAGVYHQRGL